MPKALICRCANRKLVKIPENLEESLGGFSEIVYVDDLCSSVIENPKAVADFCEEDTVVFGCHSRAIYALLDYAKAAKPKKVFDLRSGDASAISPYLESLNLSKKQVSKSSNIREESNAWYPCIDYNLCVNCGKCMDFCVFGVYEKVDGKIRVINPTNCKDNCPACARTCPKSAVIFAKCPDLKISGKQEDEESKEDVFDLLKKRRRRTVLK